MKKEIKVQKYSDACECKMKNKRVSVYKADDDIGVQFLHFNEQEKFEIMLYKKHCSKFGKNLHVNAFKMTRSTAEMLFVALCEYLKMLNEKNK